MQDAYLQKHVKDAIQQLTFFLSQPQDKKIYDTLVKACLKLPSGMSKKDDILGDTLIYGILCQADFIQNISSFHPPAAEWQWFHKKLEANLALLEELGEALSTQNTLSFNELAVHLINNNIELEQLQMHLILKNKQALLNNLDNASFFFSTLALIESTASHYQSLEEPLIEMLTYVLFQAKRKEISTENISALWDLLIVLTNPLATMDEKTKAFAEAQKIAEEWQTKFKAAWLEPQWYSQEMSAAEKAETSRILNALSSQTNLSAAESLLSDSFLLFNTFKRAYDTSDSSFIAFASFARACFLGRNLAFTLPPSKHKEALDALIAMGKGLILFLENRLGTAKETEKSDNIRTASSLMRENYHKLIALTENLAKSKSS